MSGTTFFARLVSWALAAGLLLALAACAISPGMRPTYARQAAPAPSQPFQSVALVFMPLVRPGDRLSAAGYDRTWGDHAQWRQPFFRRLEQNFAHNALDLRVIDMDSAAAPAVQPGQLQVRITPEGIIASDGNIRYMVRADASERATRYLVFSDQFFLQRSAQREADRMTWLILNSLRDARLIKPPAIGDSYGVAP